MNEILFEVLKAVIIISVMVAMRYLVPWMKEHTELAKNQMVQDIVRAAVQYAEQIFKKEPGAGADKKAVVTEFLKKLLLAKNISISDEQLDALIESAVYAMNKAAA
ncbi:MAG: phage holin [Muribaculaceae bacterium]|nr:phage holin [Muribaculaceae bacterium]